MNASSDDIPGEGITGAVEEVGTAALRTLKTRAHQQTSDIPPVHPGTVEEQSSTPLPFVLNLSKDNSVQLSHAH